MYFPVLLLWTLVYVSSGEWAPNGTWINPPYCSNQDRDCPPFNQLDDGTKAYEIREYLSATWICINFTSPYPQHSERFYLSENSNPRFFFYHKLRNYTKGDNEDNVVSRLNLPIRYQMYYNQNAAGKYLKIANDFRICYYLTLGPNPPTPNNQEEIKINIEPDTTYYVWQFNNTHFDASRFKAEVALFKDALSDDGVTDFVPSYHFTLDYGPYRHPEGHNEIWMQKL